MSEPTQEHSTESVSPLRPQMQPEAFRVEAVSCIDETIARWTISEKERKVLRAIRTFLAMAPADAIKGMADLMI